MLKFYSKVKGERKRIQTGYRIRGPSGFDSPTTGTRRIWRSPQLARTSTGRVTTVKRGIQLRGPNALSERTGSGEPRLHGKHPRVPRCRGMGRILTTINCDPASAGSRHAQLATGPLVCTTSILFTIAFESSEILANFKFANSSRFSAVFLPVSTREIRSDAKPFLADSRIFRRFLDQPCTGCPDCK